MKNLFVTSMLCMISLVCFSQSNAPLENTLGIKLENIVETTIAKNVCFNNALTWISGYSTEYAKDIDAQDKEAGSIIAKVKTVMPKVETSLTDYVVYTLFFNIKIDCRDNKFRTIIMNPVVAISSTKSDVKSMGTATLEKMIAELQAVADISAFKFKNETKWDLTEVANFSEETNKEIIEKNNKIAQLDSNDKKQKKEIKLYNNSIETLKKEAIIYSDILDRTKSTLKKITDEISASLNKSDSF